MLLSDSEWACWSNRKLAQTAWVSAPLVEDVRVAFEEAAAARGEVVDGARRRKYERKDGKVCIYKTPASGDKQRRAADPEKAVGKLVDRLIEKAEELDAEARRRLAERLRPLWGDKPGA